MQNRKCKNVLIKRGLFSYPVVAAVPGPSRVEFPLYSSTPSTKYIIYHDSTPSTKYIIYHDSTPSTIYIIYHDSTSSTIYIIYHDSTSSTIYILYHDSTSSTIYIIYHDVSILFDLHTYKSVYIKWGQMILHTYVPISLIFLYVSRCQIHFSTKNGMLQAQKWVKL